MPGQARGRAPSHECTHPCRPAQSSGWTLSRLLGLQQCCAVASLAPAASAPGVRDAAQSEATGGVLSVLMSRLGFLSEEEKARLEFETCIAMLKDGGLFHRRVPGKAPTPIWLQLTVAEDQTAARIEWRSPQLVLNRAVNKDGVALDACRQIRPSTFADDPGDPDLCFTIVADGALVVCEAPSNEVRNRWVTAGSQALAKLVPQMHEKCKKQMADERRQREIQQRKDSRDARRSEYAKAGMSNTARIMSERK